jgi:Fur family transcriptional regulator, ferric uptake regulator
MDWADHARKVLREAGYHSGAARDAILELLSRQDCCLTAQEIFDTLRTQGRAVGIASIYRGVDVLADLGLLQRMDVGDGVTRFQPVRPGGEHHHHIVCDDCGRVEAFHDEPLEQTLAALGRRAGYDLAAHDVVLRGACSDCTPSRA